MTIYVATTPFVAGTGEICFTIGSFISISRQFVPATYSNNVPASKESFPGFLPTFGDYILDAYRADNPHHMLDIV